MLPRALLLASLTLLVPGLAVAQAGGKGPDKLRPAAPSLAEQLSLARLRYYTPTTSGLRSYHCEVTANWSEMLGHLSGGTVTPDNPFITYLNSTHLFVDDDLHGAGHLVWAATGVLPAELQTQGDQFRDGIQKMFAGYFSSWDAYLNGTMVPPPAGLTLSRTPSGFMAREKAVTSETEITFDPHWLLLKAHVVQTEADTVAVPTYKSTPEGLLITDVESTITNPPSPQPTRLAIHTDYQRVDGFSLPAHIRFDLHNAGQFDFDLKGCTVERLQHAS